MGGAGDTRQCQERSRGRGRYSTPPIVHGYLIISGFVLCECECVKALRCLSVAWTSDRWKSLLVSACLTTRASLERGIRRRPPSKRRKPSTKQSTRKQEPESSTESTPNTAHQLGAPHVAMASRVLRSLLPRTLAIPGQHVRLTSSKVGTRVEHARTCLRTADAVCFDVDSTVVTTEGIDDLAAYLGCGDKVASLTAQAMGGSMPFHEALALRLGAMQPSKQQLTDMLAKEPLQLTPGVADLISTLHARTKDVYFVSGGTRYSPSPAHALTLRVYRSFVLRACRECSPRLASPQASVR